MAATIKPVRTLCLLLGLAAAGCGGSPESPAPTPRPTRGVAGIEPSATFAPATQPASTATAAPASEASATPIPATRPPAPAATPPQSTSASPAQASGPPPAVRFEITAQNLSFDKAEVRARSGAEVTAVFTNKDTAVEHNLTFSAPGLPHGDTCTGPCSASQTFTAPAAGRYTFFCNIHSTMLGGFIVDP